ncbi:MAG: D-alanyl-D-alanine carboxypeptidase family protein [Pseudomonadota bacterium]
MSRDAAHKTQRLRRRFTTRLATVLASMCLLLIGHVRAEATGPALLFDASNGAVIYSDEPDTRWHPASLTKLMTVYIIFEELRAGRLSMQDNIVTSKAARAVQPSKIGLPVGGRMTVRVGIDALIVKSANDVAIMFAEKISGSVPAFAQRMNATARRLGMTRSQFVNPNGLHAREQYSTARDMARLARALIIQYPEHAAIFTKSSMRFGKARLRSFNLLLRTFNGADGMKTGFVCASGFNIVSSATRNGRRLIAIVLGAETARIRNARAASLLQHGFENGIWKTFFFPATVATMPVAERVGGGPVNMRPKVRAWVCGWRKKKKAKPGQQAANWNDRTVVRSTRPVTASSVTGLPGPFNTDR